MNAHYLLTIHDEMGEVLLTVDTYSAKKVIADLEKFENVKDLLTHIPQAEQQPIIDAGEYKIQ